MFSSVFKKSRIGGGQGLGGRRFTQGGRRTVVIGRTFRRDYSSLEGARGPPPTAFSLLTHSRLEGDEKSQRAPSAPIEGAWPSAPLPTPLPMIVISSKDEVLSPHPQQVLDRVLQEVALPLDRNMSKHKVERTVSSDPSLPATPMSNLPFDMVHTPPGDGCTKLQ